MIKKTKSGGWKDVEPWAKGLIIGFIFGLSYIPFGFGIGDTEDSFILLRLIFWVWHFIFSAYASLFCKIFGLSGEDCAFGALSTSTIFIPILSTIAGVIIGINLKKK